MLLADYEVTYLKSISNDGTMKGCLLFLAAGRVLLDQLESLDIILIKLAPSRIVNFMNKDIKDIIQNNISEEVKKSIPGRIPLEEFNELEPEVEAMVDDIIKTHNSQGKLILYSKKDMEQILEDIHLRQAKCCKLKERNTQAYHVLSIIAQIKYNAQQLQLFGYVIEMGMVAKAASLLVRIKVRTGQHCVRQYKIENKMFVPCTTTKKRPGRPSTLTTEHTAWLIEYYDKILDAVREALSEQFNGISIILSAKLPAAIVSEATLHNRAKVVSQWISDPEFNFDNRCVFIDEAGFNLHTRRNFGRSKRGTPARAVAPSQRAICEQCVINVCLRKPQAALSSKKRKRYDGSTVLNGRIGTRTGHFIEYLDNVMDIVDENNVKCRYLVMDNAPIHTNKSISHLVEQRGYKSIYLPKHSPFLNPIEEFWSKVKMGKCEISQHYRL
ncbi:hypothetical protein INT45_000156 [Circinella minor]|uniref:Tc1-like transposase DDE domain-containing protein n=1 Tax=Circinella minor TaxID=1195481 RepID=A0A8H7S7M3_9FUNG|nr:hypothetical protein INT45_000156 [Circinella minor]